MKDLDFDELDKAINTVLSDKEVAQQAAPPPEPQNHQEPPRLPGANRVQGRPPAAQAAKPAVRRPLARPVVTPASRRGVIDIMAPPSKVPSRQAASLQPVTDVRPPQPSSTPPASPISHSETSPAEQSLRWPPKATAELNSDEVLPSASDAPVDSPVPPPAPSATDREPGVSAADDHSQGFEHFDTETHPSSNMGGDKIESAESPVHVANQAPADPPVESGAPETPPPTSPFLSDAKVEKRPLGAYSGSPPEPTAAPVTNTVEPALPAEAVPSSAAPPASTPDEASFEHDLLLTPAETEQAEHTASGVKLDHLLDDGQNDQPSTATPAPLSTVQSIPQQYKTPETPNDDTPRPVFDTNEYHAPLQDHPAAKHSSAGLWIAFGVVVALAVAGGLIIYFFGDQLGL